MIEPIVEFGDYLRQVREDRGMKRQRVADEAGLTYACLTKWEAGVNRPLEREPLERVCDALKLPKGSEERAKLLWLCRGWHERYEPLEGVPGQRCHQLIGRSELIDEIDDLLLNPQARLRMVLLAAFGGRGKTEIARAAAEGLVKVGHFDDVAWIRLRNAEFADGSIVTSALPGVPRTRENIIAMIAHRLACRTGPELQARLTAPPPAPPLLIVVDNLEALAEADRASLLEDLHRLLGDGRSRAIVISRFDVDAPYVQRPEVPGLSPVAARKLLRDESHRLRAPALRGASDDVLDEIGRLTDGMPLALHLAVAQSRHHDLDLVLQIFREARALGGGQEFYAFLYWQAWTALSPAARGLLVYLGTTTVTSRTPRQLLDIGLAAEVTLDRPTLARAIDELTRWFLIQYEAPKTPGHDGRYDVHPLTRAFVADPQTRAEWERDFDPGALWWEASKRHEALIERALGR